MPILDWLNKNEAINTASKVPYRILKANKELSYGENNENMIIKGDNLEALKALLPYYKGQVKCIYIDPPYNTGNAFEHYDDNLEHSKWLTLIYPRLELLRELLSEDGSIWISIDEKEGHYLKVLCDEVFGRNNFIIQTTIQRGAATGHKAINPAPVQVCDYMICYAKNKSLWTYTPVYKERSYDKAYNQIILNYDDKWENWEFTSLKNYLQANDIKIEQAVQKFPEKIIRFAQPDYNGVGKETKFLIDLSKANPDKIYCQKREGLQDIYLVNGNRILFYKDKMRIINGKLVTAELVTNIWDDMNYQGIAKEGNITFKKSKKPEAQVKRIFEMSTQKGDLVLDSFLGSGTTCAVAQKMGRKYIGIEMGEHAITHCVPRMKAVIDGEQGGISKTLNWQGGGGYTFYDLGETVFDENGNINKNVDFKTLASHIWFSETKTPLLDFEKSPLLGVYNGTAYYLLYNGILGDKKPDGGNVLTQKIFDTLPKFDGKKVIYGEATRINEEKRKINNITFKQTPYDIKAR